jgi:tryptophan synthase beta chain
MKVGRELGPDATLLVNLSGRGDKDVDTAAKWFDVVSDKELVQSATAVVEQDPQDASGEGW